MDVEIKQKWVEALRSGNFVQGDGKLMDHYESKIVGKPVCCCLGVLEHVCGTPLENIEGIEFPAYQPNSKCPKEFISTTEDSIAVILANMNDGDEGRHIKKHNFLEIADYIEQNL